MTPLDQTLSLGADVAVLSTTKFLGNGVDNGGAVLLSQSGVERERRQILKDIPPDDTAAINEALKHQSILRRVANHGLTQAHIVSDNMLKRAPYSVLRLKRQAQSAQILADHISRDYGGKAKILSPTLANHPQAELSSRQMKGSPVFSIQFETQQQAFTFINALIDNGISTVNNFGSPRTTTAHPASTTHSSLSAEMQSLQGLTPGLVRISVGIENVDYLKKAFDQALNKVFAATPPQFDATPASSPAAHL
jgi:cystathionine beta-lyase/cystathionine gamma-synthase